MHAIETPAEAEKKINEPDDVGYTGITISDLLGSDEDIKNLNFDVEQATKELNEKTIKLSIQDVVASDLETAAEEISQMRDQAKACITTNTAVIKKIDAVLPPIDPQKEVTLTPNQQYLLRKKINASTLVSECKLFVLRAEEAISAFNTTAQKIKKTKLFTKKKALVKTLPNLREELKTWYDDVEWRDINEKIGFSSYQFQEFNVLLIVCFFSILLGIFVWHKLRNFAKEIDYDSKADKIAQNVILVLKHNIVELITFIMLFASTSLYDFHHEISTELPNLFAICIIYYLTKCLIQFCFMPPNPALPYCDISKKVAKRLSYKLMLLLQGVWVFAIGFLLLYEPEQHTVLNELILGICVTVAAVVIFSILLTINNAPQFLSKHRVIRGVFSLIITFALVLIITCQWIGYPTIAKYVLSSTTYSIASVFLIWLVYSLYIRALNCLNSRKYKWEIKLQKFLQLPDGESPLELTLLKLFGFLIFCVSLALVLNEIWSISEWWSYQVNQAFFDGFIIGESKIIPFRIILSLLVLAVGMLALKAGKQVMLKNVGGTSPAQEAHIMIMSYIFHIGLILLALVVGGFNLGGLALIAGALSVGIGFGLQNIVNNFVSGIILLLERPIKKGDRIVVGDKEGYVTHVGVRSTRVTTIEKTDVIVPNAELIGSRVTNFMYNNKKWLTIVKVGVEYGSNIELVKKLLMDVAINHPDVVKTGHEAPAVFFMSFGDSTLDFELWVVTQNVNEKFHVLTDLNSEIDKVFKENNVVIAFPQQDIHIKDTTNIPLVNKRTD